LFSRRTGAIFGVLSHRAGLSATAEHFCGFSAHKILTELQAGKKISDC